MTEAQKKWLETNKVWEQKKPGKLFSRVGIVDRYGKFSLASTKAGANVSGLKDGDILLGIPV